jgi:hypothetical protein
MSKLDHVTKNPLITQLKSLTNETIAVKGLDTLVDIIEGRQPSGLLDTLCFVHMGYCFSFIIHEHDAANRSAELFGQAMSYSSLFSREDRQLYIQIVKAIWKPANMTDAGVVSILRAKASASVSRSPSIEGKEPGFAATHRSDADSLVSVAKYFLDQLELATLRVVDDVVIQTSQLYMEHFTMSMNIDSLPVAAADLILKKNFSHYTHCGPFAASLNNLIQRINSEFISARRLELELIEIGKVSKPTSCVFMVG